MKLSHLVSLVALSVVVAMLAPGCDVTSSPSPSPSSATKTDASGDTPVTAATPDKTGTPEKSAAASTAEKNVEIDGDCHQWGGSPQRNNVRRGVNVPDRWQVGEQDPKTGEWIGAENIRWVAKLGSQTYGNPVISGGKAFIGTNNTGGWMKRYPSDVDLGCMIAFDARDGKFLWQHSSEKLPTGRVHDWPLQGICSAAYVEGDRLWYVSSRGHVVCLDTEGYYDGEDDGEVTGEWARIFLIGPQLTAGLDDQEASEALLLTLETAGVKLTYDITVESVEKGSKWKLIVGDAEGKTVTYGVSLADGNVSVRRDGTADGEGLIVEAADMLSSGLDQGKMNDALRKLMADRGEPLAEKFDIKKEGPKWNLAAEVDGKMRSFQMSMQGPNLTCFKRVTVDDKHEADVVWTYDMMKDLGISQHNMCSCSVTGAGDLLFVNTANGVDASHINIPAPDAASFFAINKKTGKVLWTDNSPGLNILHGQWSSPAYAEFKDGPQVIFAGGDGWVYSFDPRGTDEGKSKLLWKFDCNPKESKWELQGKGTRNNIIATPVVHEGRIYVAVGQDPEHREGEGHLWCIDPTKRGDVSSEIVILRDEADRPAAERTKIPHRRLQALDVSQGEVAIANPNSAMIWHYAGYDKNGNKKLEFEEEMHRSCGTVAIKDNLLFIADFSGLFHCLDVKTGKVHWTYDMLAEAWGSPLITDGKVYIGDADGDIAVFKLSADPEVAMPDGEPIVENNMVNSVYTTPVLAHNVLYIANRNNLFAIEAPRQVSEEKKNE